MNEVQELGEVFVEALHFLAPFMENISDGRYRKSSIYYELAATASVNSYFQLGNQISDVTDGLPVKFHVFPLRRTFIPRHVRFDLKSVVLSVLDQPSAVLKAAYDNPAAFWRNHLNMNNRAFKRQHGRIWEGSFATDGVTAAITKRVPLSMKAGQKRGRPVEAPENADVFPSIHDLPALGLLEQEEDVVYCDPNRRNMLFCMHHLSTPTAPRTL